MAKPFNAPLTFKITSFRKECRPYRNCVSIGDGDAERAACMRLQAPHDRKAMLGSNRDSADEKRWIKSVKLQELPTCQQLIIQHEMLQMRLADIVESSGFCDLKARFAGSSGAGKACGCQLVHFNNRPLDPVQRSTSIGSTSSMPARTSQEGMAAHRSLSRPGSQQLPPLGAERFTNSKRSSAHGEVDYPAPGRLFDRSGGSVSCSAIPGVGGGVGMSAAAGTAEHSETVEGRPASALKDRAEREMTTSQTTNLWKVPSGGDSRSGSRSSYHGIGGVAKKRPMLGSPHRLSGLGGRGAGAVWREHSAPAATRGF